MNEQVDVVDFRVWMTGLQCNIVCWSMLIVELVQSIVWFYDLDYSWPYGVLFILEKSSSKVNY